MFTVWRFLFPRLQLEQEECTMWEKTDGIKFIPIYGLILACTEGEKGPNQYGADPKNQLEDINEIGKE